MLSNRTLYTHTGRRVRFYDDLVRGRVITLNVAYTRCTQNCLQWCRRGLRADRAFARRGEHGRGGLA